MSLPAAILLAPSDNVAVANGRLEPGTALPGGGATLSAIEPGHKVAVRAISLGLGSR